MFFFSALFSWFWCFVSKNRTVAVASEWLEPVFVVRSKRAEADFGAQNTPSGVIAKTLMFKSVF